MPLVNLVETIARTTIEAMLNGLWQGTLLVTMVWCLLKAVPRLNATTRYVIWWGALIAVICLPVAAALAPFARGYDLARNAKAAPGDSFEVVISPEAPRAADRISSIAPATEAVDLNEAGGQARAERIDSAGSFFPVRLPGRWAIFLFAAWILIALVMMGRISWSYCYLRRVKRNCSPLAGSYPEGLKRWLAYARLKRRFELRASEETSVPMVIGLIEPVIVIPQALARELTEEEFEQVALHELAHVRRRDDWMKLLQRLIEAFLFFHPAVLWISRQLNLEREVACDDSVISLTGRPRPYAACLVKLLELTTSRQTSLLAPGAVTIKRQISSRIEMIVDKRRNATLTLSKACLFIMLVALAVVVAQSARIAPALALTEPTASYVEPGGELFAQSLEDQIDLNELAAPNNPPRSDSLTGKNDKLIDSQVETGETNVASFRTTKQTQGRLPDPPHPPVPPTPPAPPPVSPSSIPSVPAPPALPADHSREAQAAYDRLMADYNQLVSKYREQMREYDKGVEKYREGMREYDRKMDQYNKDMQRYNIDMERYHKELREFEKLVYEKVPGAILNVIAEQIAAVDIKLDAAARDKLDRELQQVAAVLARELIEKLKDLKFNRPAGHITMVSFLSTAAVRNRLRELFNNLDVSRDESTRTKLSLVADRAAPALQSLVVYKWP